MFELIKISDYDLNKYHKLTNYLKAHFKPNTFAYTTKMQNGLVTRGQKKKPWIQSSGSVGIALALKHSNPGIVGLILSYSLATIINGQTKWPNDVVVNRKKIAGLMIFPVKNNEIVVGISINLNNETISSEISDVATSLYLEHKQKYEVKSFVEKLVTTFSYYLKNYHLDLLVSKEILKDQEIKIGPDVFKFLSLNNDGSGVFLKNNNRVVLTSLDISFTNFYK